MFEMFMFMWKLQEVQNHIVNFNIFCSTIILCLVVSSFLQKNFYVKQSNF